MLNYHLSVLHFYSLSPRAIRIFHLLEIVLHRRSEWPRGLKHELSPSARILCSFFPYELSRVWVEAQRRSDLPSRSATYCV
jgi:hypothetical protein